MRQRNHHYMGVQIPKVKRQFEGGKRRPVVKYSDSLPWNMQKRLNRSRFRLGFGLADEMPMAAQRAGTKSGKAWIRHCTNSFISKIFKGGHIITSRPREVRSIAMFVPVCLPARVSPKNHMSRLHEFVCTRACTFGCGLVLLWCQSNTLCTSGFADDVMFSHSGPYSARHWQ